MQQYKITRNRQNIGISIHGSATFIIDRDTASDIVHALWSELDSMDDTPCPFSNPESTIGETVDK